MRAAALVSLALAACAPARPGPQPMIPERACRAQSADAVLGQTASLARAQEAMRLAGARSVRYLRPGEMVTMEFVATRLNLRVDAQEKIVAVTCG